MSKEEFNWFWKDTTKEGVLNQFYYEHIQLREEIERINKAIEYIEWQKNNPQYDNIWRKYECESLVDILRGGSNE